MQTALRAFPGSVDPSATCKFEHVSIGAQCDSTFDHTVNQINKLSFCTVVII